MEPFLAEEVRKRRSWDMGLFSSQWVQLTVGHAGQTVSQAYRKVGTHGGWSRVDLGMDDKEGSCDKNH